MPDRHTALQPIPVEQLETLLDRRAEQQQRPRATPREVLAVWMGNAGAGVGAALLTGVGCSVAGVVLWPTGVQVAGAVGGVVFGAAMVWRALTDEATAQLSNRRVRRLVSQIEAEKAAQVAKLTRQLGAAFDAIETLEGELDRITRQRDAALSDARTARQGASNYVAPVKVNPQELTDAEAMIRHRFDAGQPLSLSVAKEQRKWTQPRWQAALDLLVAAGVVYVQGTRQRYVHDTLGEAMSELHTYMMQARAHEMPPPMPRQSSAWADDDDDTEG
jgi:hypothetical protein